MPIAIRMSRRYVYRASVHKIILRKILVVYSSCKHVRGFSKLGAGESICGNKITKIGKENKKDTV